MKRTRRTAKPETLTSEERVRRAVKVLQTPKGLVSHRIEFLKLKGCTTTEIMEALNQATDGELVRTALGDPT